MNVLKGLLALAVVFLFAQCTDNKGTSTEASAPAVAGTNMKIAYVEVDSLLTKYRYWNDLNGLMIQKEENIRTTLNEKAKELDGEMREFQRKLENNGFCQPRTCRTGKRTSVAETARLAAVAGKALC